MLDKPALKAAIVEAFSNPSTNNNVETVSQKLADAIEAYVKSGTVTGTCPPNGPLTNGKVE
jgi:hypothetical protein